MARPTRGERSQTLSDLHSYSVNLKSRDIYVHSIHDHEEEMGVDYRQASVFIKNLHMLNHMGPEPILVHFQSIGGDWYNGMAMYNAIEFSKASITILSYAQASSMSGIIIQAAKHRVLMPSCHFMMHYGSTDVYGGQHPLAVEQAMLLEKKDSERMLMLFAKRAIKSGKYFKEKRASKPEYAYNFFEKMLKEKVDWFLDPEEAVYYGLADGVLGDRKYKDMEALKG